MFEHYHEKLFMAYTRFGKVCRFLSRQVDIVDSCLLDQALERGGHGLTPEEVARAYDAACTPDIFVFDRERKLVYRGQLDGSRPGNDVPVNGKDLRGALGALLAAATGVVGASVVGGAWVVGATVADTSVGCSVAVVASSPDDEQAATVVAAAMPMISRCRCLTCVRPRPRRSVEPPP